MGVLLADRLLAQRAGWETFGPPLYQVNAVETAPGARTTVYAAGSIYEESQSAVFVSEDGLVLERQHRHLQPAGAVKRRQALEIAVY